MQNSQGDAWICMELMETSLDILYKLVYGKLGQAIPEDILGVIALAVSSFLFLVATLWCQIFLQFYLLSNQELHICCIQLHED